MTAKGTTKSKPRRTVVKPAADSAAYWIKKLNLGAHPEGGWYREMYRSGEKIPRQALPQRYSGDRTFATAIYYLLEGGQHSTLHRIKSDELWLFMAGSPLSISSIDQTGKLHVVRLGIRLDRRESIHALVPAGHWFGAQPVEPKSFSLVTCVVAPGFDFSDFEMGRQEDLLKQFPRCKKVIELLGKP